MDQVELFTVEDSFEIVGRGVVLVPDFSVPEGWRDRACLVTLVTTTGQRIETPAQFNLSHFNLSDPKAPSDKRWRVVVFLNNWKGKVPVASKLFVPGEIHQAINAGLRPGH